ncbi:Laccase-14, partial [Armadillidium vulgare]
QLNEVLKECNTGNICLRNLNSTFELPQSLKQKTADVTLFLEVERGVKNLESFRTDQDFEESETLLSSRYSYPTINGFVHRSPSTPLIFKENFPSKCDLESGGKYFGNKCLHIIKIPLGSVTDIFMIDEGKDDLTSSFHLHGFRFYVLNEGRIKKKGDSETKITELLKKMESEEKLSKKLEFPVQKDTISVPQGGYTLIRFLADNPG